MLPMRRACENADPNRLSEPTVPSMSRHLIGVVVAGRYEPTALPALLKVGAGLF